MNEGNPEIELERTPKKAVIPASGLLVFESHHAPGFSGQAKDTSSKFHLVIAGHSRWEGGGRRYFLGPDTLIHIPAGQAYSQADLPNDPVTVYGVHYRTELLSAALSSQLTALGMLSIDLGSANVNQARVVRSIFQEMLFEQGAGQEGWEMMLQSRLIDLAVRTLRLARRRGRNDLPAFEPGNDSTERVARYALRLKSRFFRQETIEEASKAVGLGRRQFTDLFRKVTGQSWRRYVLGLRLNHAAGLLAETERSVVAVAFESGFDDLSYFNHSFKTAYGCSPLAYREQRQVRLPVKSAASSKPVGDGEPSAGFKLRGIKGWFWTAEQYLEEIPFLPCLKMNFLMDCYGSMISSQSVLQPGKTGSNEWWKPMTEDRKEAYARIICACQDNDIKFCFALHPQLGSPRPLNPDRAEDVEQFYQHYAWAQSQGVQWFSICVDDTGWGVGGPAASGLGHARLVNTVLARLRDRDKTAQFTFCPVICWGDATNPEHRDYLEVLAREMHPEVYVFWNGDSIVTPRITRVAAESYRQVVKHRLFLWDNYPVNDGSPTLHLGPVSGRETDLHEVIDGYLSNPMHTQNQINRIPLATCADYASNPREYNPARSIGQAILRLAKTSEQQRVIKDLVETYPGFIVAGGGTGTNPVRAKFGNLVAVRDSRSSAQTFIHHLENILTRLATQFPKQFLSTRKTITEDISWMKKQIGSKK
ncbi:beta-N-acetylglucosaminidase domain-containing protein [Pedosphaera parvula]|uniref:Transcriptional regulator, AraC family n=1 Tax=Pedosphaera parvula (strain Ellin514) TaxID=320771 RepID=B9XAJ2_PEDPL|nr:beta-N-acetylglucosaminidase domain-containing protein [Pedosphaera parvula]EEF63027.1 transcriptional regulator, AraC family [Pedosphaera parvula Ellin514]